MNKKVHIVVVTYNRCDLLRECLKALLKLNYKNFMIYLINNHSTDDTEQIIKQEFKNSKIQYYDTGKNLGGAGGFNFGMKIANELPCDYIWLMDDDTIVNANSLTELVKQAVEVHKDNFGFLCSNVRFTDGSPCKMNIPHSYQNYKRLPLYLMSENENTIKPIRVLHASFVSFFVKQSVVLEVGLPIKEFFIWCDDTEYSLRISKKYPSYFCNKSIVVHKMKENTDTSPKEFINGDSKRVFRFFYAYRNRLYIAKHLGLKKLLFYMIKFFIVTLQIIFSFSKDKKIKLKILWSGFIAGITFNPKIEYIQK